jgi:hypothetical protein
MKQCMNRLIVLSIALAFTSNCYAWGRDGHRLTGLIAEKFLTPKTQERLQTILQGKSLADVSTWMDEQRPALVKFDSTTPLWHYNDVPVCEKAKLADYCPDGNCASEKTKKYVKVLSDSDSTLEEQADAVKFIVHMVGDIHQPLHAADNLDRGGNLVKVNFDGNRIKLHQAWDTGLVAEAQDGKSEEEFGNNLYATYGTKAKMSAKGNIGQWVAESHKLAAKYTYGGLSGFACKQKISGTPVLDDAYRKAAVGVIQLQLTKAGARIAYLLNNALDD